jgi:drug/metabolite transporter superfamily protein YnfA
MFVAFGVLALGRVLAACGGVFIVGSIDANLHASASADSEAVRAALKK